MGRFNVYISDALEERMASHRDNLNWSNLAQAAFERAINLEELKGKDMDQATIERLRQSRASNEERRQAEGHALGKEWASNVAEFEDLQRVVDVTWDAVRGDEEDGYAQRSLTSALLDDDNPSWDEVGDQMEEIFGRNSPTVAEIEGFITGAKEVFDLV